MFAQLPTQVREYCILQVAVSNGSKVPWVVKPIDFKYQRTDGVEVPSAQPRDVVQEFIEKAGRSDVIKLISTYEMGLYGMQRIKSTNGYEQRRQCAQTELTNSKLKAAAAASAIAFVDTKLMPGQTTDGAVFYDTHGKPLTTGKLIVRVAAELYQFPVVP